MCISIQQKKKKIHERSDHPFGTNDLLVLQMWYRFERKLALGIPFCTRPEPTAVRAAPTSAYVIHLYLQKRRQNKWMNNCHWVGGGLWNLALAMKEKCKTVEQQKFQVSEEVVVLTRQLSHPLGSGFPSIAYPQKPLMHSFTKKQTQIPAILVICIFNISLGNHCQSSYLMITFGVANHKSVALKWRKLAWLQYQIKLLYYKMGKRVVHRIVMKCLNFRMIRPMVQKLQRRLDWSAIPSKGVGILASTMQVLFIPLHIKTKRRKTTPCCYLGTDIQRAT